MQSVAAGVCQAGVTEQECPQCQATIPTFPGYTTWCDKCEWNLGLEESARPRNIYEALYRSLGKRMSYNLFVRLKTSKSLRPSMNPGTALAFVMSGFVYDFVILFGIAGLYLLLTSQGNPLLLILGVLCLLLAWASRPRPRRIAEDSFVASRDEFPVLYETADNIARALGAAPVNAIVLDDDYNASYTEVGWGKKRVVLQLGLPLVAVLNPQEKVALLAHELAHGVNGDITRHFFVGNALKTLVDWFQAMRPSLSDEDEALFFFNKLVILPLTALVFLWLYLLVHLLWRDSQRAEYLADVLAAKVAGTEATLSGLEKSYFDVNYHKLLLRMSLLNSSKNVFLELKREVEQAPPRELERLSRLAHKSDARLDATHPPTPYRMEVLRSFPPFQPQVALSDDQASRLDAELAMLHAGTQKQLLQLYKELFHS